MRCNFIICYLFYYYLLFSKRESVCERSDEKIYWEKWLKMIDSVQREMVYAVANEFLICLCWLFQSTVVALTFHCFDCLLANEMAPRTQKNCASALLCSDVIGSTQSGAPFILVYDVGSTFASCSMTRFQSLAFFLQI